MRTIEKIVSLFAVLVFVGLLVNHGVMDFSGVDKAKQIAQDAVKSEEGQALISETKEVSKKTFWSLLGGIKETFGEESTGQQTQTGSQPGTAVSVARNPCQLTGVVDGDTIKVTIDGTEKTVRLIGIDTPESVNPDESKNNEYGEYASEYTKSLLQNVNTLYLEYDESKEDTYGRTLAYVWFSDDSADAETGMLNGLLVAKGYAYDKVYMPNNRYADRFMQFRMKAKNDKAGLWAYDGFAALWEQ